LTFRFRTLALAPVLAAAPLTLANPYSAHKTTHVIFVMTDGFRWEEMFRGADASLMNKRNGNVSDEARLKSAYWRDTADARREGCCRSCGR
jgi:hypothetical protein